MPALKGNQPTLHQKVQDYFVAMGESGELSRLPPYSEEEPAHGRQETRCTTVAPAPPEIRALPAWESIRTIVLLTTETIHLSSGQRKEQVRYYVSSAEPDAELLAKVIRKHWSIENQLQLGFGCFISRGPAAHSASRVGTEYGIGIPISALLTPRCHRSRGKH